MTDTRRSRAASDSAISPVRSRLPSFTTTTRQSSPSIAESHATASATVFSMLPSSLYARKATPSRGSFSADIDDPPRGRDPAEDDQQDPGIVDQQGARRAAH